MFTVASILTKYNSIVVNELKNSYQTPKLSRSNKDGMIIFLEIRNSFV